MSKMVLTRNDAEKFLSVLDLSKSSVASDLAWHIRQHMEQFTKTNYTAVTLTLEILK